MSPKNKICTVIFTLFLIGTGSINAQADFRNSNWGATSAQVKASESHKLISENLVRISYDCELADIKGKLVYSFTHSNKLLRTKYLLTPEYTNTNYYIRDYKMFEELLLQKYGKMQGQTASSLSGPVLKESDWPVQLASGNLRIETKWGNSKTNILLTLSNIGGNPVIQIDYMSKEINEMDLQEKKKKVIAQL